jgi:ABC-type transporter Mla subunit MlaD
MSDDTTGTGYTTVGLGDLFALFGAPNPLAGIGRSVDQFRRAVNDMFTAVETFTETMNQLNQVASRLNALLDEVEEPVRALMPQVTRTVRTADVVTEQMYDLVGVFADLAKRLQPISGLAETAGSVFALRNRLPGFGVAEAGAAIAREMTTTAHPADTTGASKAPAETAPAKKAPSKKTPAKKSPATKTPAKKTPATKTPGTTSAPGRPD